MKPRRVILTIEVETDIPLKILRSMVHMNFACIRNGVWKWPRILQVSANVVKAEKKRKGKR